VRKQNTIFGGGGGRRLFGDAEAAELLRNLFNGGGATGSGFIVGSGTTNEEFGFGFGFGKLKREKMKRRRRRIRRRKGKSVEEGEVSCRKQHLSNS